MLEERIAWRETKMSDQKDAVYSVRVLPEASVCGECGSMVPIGIVGYRDDTVLCERCLFARDAVLGMLTKIAEMSVIFTRIYLEGDQHAEYWEAMLEMGMFHYLLNGALEKQLPEISERLRIEEVAQVN